MSLPSLNALRAFEAAARLLSFKDAAEELKITPSAVSRHIRSLELTLGIELFERGFRQVQLTEKATHYAKRLSEAFKAIQEFNRRSHGLWTGSAAQAEARDALHQRHIHEPLARRSLASVPRRASRVRARGFDPRRSGQGRQSARRSSHPVHGRRNRRPGAHPACLADHHSRLCAVAAERPERIAASR